MYAKKVKSKTKWWVKYVIKQNLAKKVVYVWIILYLRTSSKHKCVSMLLAIAELLVPFLVAILATSWVFPKVLKISLSKEHLIKVLFLVKGT